MTGIRRAAVLGSPIAHSQSPTLHRAAFEALGLTGWTYDRIECTGEQLPSLVDGLGPEWVGLSVTMPNKIAALEFATERTSRAEVIGSANTLIRVPSGWRADCTDVDGVTGALADAGVTDLAGKTVAVVGAGGTARPALVAAASLGARAVRLIARDEARAQGAVRCGRAVGLDTTWVGFDAGALTDAVFGCAAVISTVPAAGAAPLADALSRTPLLLDAIYDPWPTPLAAAVSRAGGVVVGGLAMLLNQAFGQVEQFTESRRPGRRCRRRWLRAFAGPTDEPAVAGAEANDLWRTSGAVVYPQAASLSLLSEGTPCDSRSMNSLCAAAVGLAAGWFAPAVVEQWIGNGRALRVPSAVTSAVLFAVAAALPAGDAFAAVAYWSLCLALVDYSCHRLPNALTLSGAAAVLAAAIWDGFGVAALVGGALLGLLYAVVNIATRGGVGAGDVKLALPLGAVAALGGGAAWLATAVLAPFGTAVLALAARRADPRHRAVPHGPSMCAATLVAVATVGA